MYPLTEFTHEFEGRTLTTITFRGRFAWIAREIGLVLGYSRDGRRLPAKIIGGWKDAFIESHDYVVLDGPELEAFRVALLVGDIGTRPSKNHGRLVLLYEPGLHMVLARTSKPVGHRLRLFLLDEVLPHLTRTACANASASAEHAKPGAEHAKPGAEHAEPGAEHAEPGAERAERTEAADGQMHPDARQIHLHIQSRRVRTIDVQMMREQRLAAQHDLRERMFQAASLRSTVQTLAQLGTIDDDQVQAYEVMATEIALGYDLVGLHPRGVETWESPEEIAERLGISPRRVWRAIARLWLRGDIDRVAHATGNGPARGDRASFVFFYAVGDVERIEQEIRERDEARGDRA